MSVVLCKECGHDVAAHDVFTGVCTYCERIGGYCGSKAKFGEWENVTQHEASISIISGASKPLPTPAPNEKPSTNDFNEIDWADFNEIDKQPPLTDSDAQIRGPVDMDLSDLESSSSTSGPQDMDLSDLEGQPEETYPDEFEKIQAERKKMKEAGKVRANPEYEAWRAGYSEAELKRGDYGIYRATQFDGPKLGTQEQIINEQVEFSKKNSWYGNHPNITRAEFWKQMQEFEDKKYARALLDCRNAEDHQVNYAPDGSSFMREYPDGTVYTYERTTLGNGNVQEYKEYLYPDGKRIGVIVDLNESKTSTNNAQVRNVFSEKSIDFQPNAETHIIHSETVTVTTSAQGDRQVALPSLDDLETELPATPPEKSSQLDKMKSEITRTYRHNPWSEEL